MKTGAPGIHKTTLAAVEEYGVTRLLDELGSELRKGDRPTLAGGYFSEAGHG